MNREMLCGWLDLPKAVWPPDAWALLGLPKGDHDLPTLEKRVQDRMAKLRCYQLSYPEEATEGMNRLAAAFVTLTEACPKAAPNLPTEKPTDPIMSKDDTSVREKTKMDWQAAPPPVRTELPAASPRKPGKIAPMSPEALAEDETSNGAVLTAKPFVAPSKRRHEVDAKLTRELAEESVEATGNLGTLEALIERVEQTRRLLHVWDQLGRHLRRSQRKPRPGKPKHSRHAWKR